jgi:hypothetical protein
MFEEMECTVLSLGDVKNCEKNIDVMTEEESHFLVTAR